ncbi:hypothetical protein B0H14DRAFT_2748835 [Mycena olivaceomarginata]|nr:hypothetical protein B0H14DRAFT_2748835 [Mycena olivaceomarginata]
MWFTDFIHFRFLPGGLINMDPGSYMREVLTTWHQSLISIDPGSHMQEALDTLVSLRREDLMRPLNIPETCLCLGHVYSGQRTVAKLATGTVTAEPTWAATGVHICEEGEEWLPEQYFPTTEEELSDGFTHFIVPLIGKTRKWLSLLDNKHCYGYFLTAEMWFGESGPDVQLSWMAQAQSILSKYGPSMECKLSNLRVCKPSALHLTWEMVLAAELVPSTEESWAIVNNLPENIHVFIQVPKIKDARIEEPQIYWSTETHIIDRGCIPPGSLKIRMSWETDSSVVQWESHHYEVASTVLKEHGFDPSTDSAALSLNLPLLEIPDPHDSSYQNGSESSWRRGNHAKDPHTLQEVDW